MATIKEIADLAGVSRGTVDRVLNGRSGVNPDTAERIKNIAQALHYKPNRAGLILAAQKKNLKLGVILFSSENPFFIDVLAGVNDKSKELSAYNCTVIIKQIASNVEDQLSAIEELCLEQVSGIAIAPFNDERIRKKINDLFDIGIPVVTLNTDIMNSKRIAYVGSHYFRSGETAAGLMHLMTQPDIKLGIITGASNILCHTERIAGFLSALQALNPQANVVDIIENHDDDLESYEKTTQLLLNHPEINALFFAAAGVYGGCRSVVELNRQQDMRIITFDHVPTTVKLIESGIISATICQQPNLQGSKPLDILFSYLITGEMPKETLHYVSTDIRIRENIREI